MNRTGQVQRPEQDVLLFQLGRVQRSSDHGVQTPTARVPTALQRSGDFSQTMTSAGALIRIFDPLTTAADSTQASGFSRQLFPGNALPANRVDPIMKKVLGYYPEPTLPISPTVNVNWSQNFSQIVKTTRWYGRADHNFSDRNKMFFRYGYDVTPRVSPYTNIASPAREPMVAATRIQKEAVSESATPTRFRRASSESSAPDLHAESTLSLR